MNHHEQLHHAAFDPGTIQPVPTRPGLFLTDVHGGAVYRAEPVSWQVGPYHRVPYVAHAGDGSQAVPHVEESRQQRHAAAELGLFAVHGGGGANYDAGPMPADPSLSVENYLIGDFVPGNPLAVLGQLGITHHAPALVPSRIGTGGRSGW